MLSKERLYHLYWNEGLSIRKVAKEIGVTQDKVRYWIKKHKIKTRRCFKQNPKRIPKEKLMEMYYDEDMTLEQIGKIVGAHLRTVSDWMSYYGLETYNPEDRFRKDIPKSLIEKLYLEEKHSIYDIEKITGYNHETIRKYMKEYGIERRGISGENHYCYNPNIKDEDRERNRSMEGYYSWRMSVYKRDKYTCQICGERDKRVNAHHIEGYGSNPELRTEVSNGVTLCDDCHWLYHSIYGVNGATKENYKEFQNKYLKSKPKKQLSLFEAS